MKLKLSLLILFCTMLIGWTLTEDTKNVKCLIQMTNYDGEGAYVIVSLLDAQGEYVETLRVQGKDPEWYNEISEWWKFYGKYRPNIDGISGETIAGGKREVAVLAIPTDKIDQGYQLRFETAVEDQEYYPSEIQIPLTLENLKSKHEGKGFIRYVRLLAE
jgi:hypothetical protein